VPAPADEKHAVISGCGSRTFQPDIPAGGAVILSDNNATVSERKPPDH